MFALVFRKRCKGINFFTIIQIIQPLFYVNIETFSKKVSDIKNSALTQYHASAEYIKQSLYLLLLYNNKVIVLLSFLNENVFVIEKILAVDYLIKRCKLLFVNRHSTTLYKFTHLTF